MVTLSLGDSEAIIGMHSECLSLADLIVIIIYK